MTSRTVLPAPADPWTVDDLVRLAPDDGYRYELLDGLLLMSPSPLLRHQVALLGLYRVLWAARPPGWTVLVAPYDVVLSADTLLVPDLVASPEADFGQHRFDGAPRLVVEVASPSTRRLDLLLKRDRYQQAGCASYWLLEPGSATSPPSLTVLELRDGLYVQRARVAGTEVVEVSLPFPVRLSPRELLE